MLGCIQRGLQLRLEQPTSHTIAGVDPVGHPDFMQLDRAESMHGQRAWRGDALCSLLVVCSRLSLEWNARSGGRRWHRRCVGHRCIGQSFGGVCSAFQ